MNEEGNDLVSAVSFDHGLCESVESLRADRYSRPSRIERRRSLTVDVVGVSILRLAPERACLSVRIAEGVCQGWVAMHRVLAHDCSARGEF